MAIEPFEIDERWFVILAQSEHAVLTKHRFSGDITAWKLVWWYSWNKKTETEAWNEYLKYCGGNREVRRFNIEEECKIFGSYQRELIIKSHHSAIVKIDKDFIAFRLRWKGTCDGYGPDYDEKIAWKHYMDLALT